jgi:ribonuclease HI
MQTTVYTDGSCLGNPGPGGYCALIVAPSGTCTKITGEAAHTTNNRMELMATIAALEELEPGTTLVLQSDSEYLVNGMNKYIEDWRDRDWKTAAKKPLLNADLWQRLYELDRRHRVEWVWVARNKGNKHSKLADRFAREAATKVRDRIARRTTQSHPILPDDARRAVR